MTLLKEHYPKEPVPESGSELTFLEDHDPD
jgi:hypothetical protein